MLSHFRTLALILRQRRSVALQLNTVELMGLTYIKNTHGPTPREFKVVVDEMVATDLVDKVKAKHFTFTQKKYLPVLKPDLSCHFAG